MNALNKIMIGIGLIAAPLAPAAAQRMTGSTFVANAGASDLYEKTSSQLVLRSSRNRQVRDFAQQMVADHSKSTANVTRAARAGGVRAAPPRLNAEQSRMVAQLRRANGTQRDRLYIQQQKTAHRQALALHSGYARSGTIAPLRHAAGEVAPVVRHHIAMLERM